jgi:microcystin-dependent protein
MARVKIKDIVINRSTGVPITGSCSVTARGTGTNATLYSSTGTTIANPTAVTSGVITAWVDEGSWDLNISGSGFTSFVQELEAWRGDHLVLEPGLRLNQLTVPNGAVDLSSQRITNLATPTAATDAATRGYVDTAVTGVSTPPVVPVGSLVDYVGSADPADTRYVIANGRSLLRADYTALFALIGTTYGSVDGTHFNLPDLRGRTTVGAGQGAGLTNRTLGATGGAEDVLLTANQSGLRAHAHQTIKNDFSAPGNAGVVTDGAASGTAYNTVTTAGPLNAVDSHTNMQPYVVLNKLIRVL